MLSLNLCNLLNLLVLMVPGAGIEPARYFYRGILSFSGHVNQIYLVDLYTLYRSKKYLSERSGAHLGHNPASFSSILMAFNCLKVYQICTIGPKFKLVFCIIIVSILSGCGQAEDDSNQIEWTGNITEQSDRFILSYDTEKFPESQLPKIERWWDDVQMCAGVSVDISDIPLIIEYMGISDMPEGRSGRIVYKDRYTRIVYEDIYRGGRTTRHEMIHYLIYIIDRSVNQGHSHIFWTLCPGHYLG